MACDTNKSGLNLNENIKTTRKSYICYCSDYDNPLLNPSGFK